MSRVSLMHAVVAATLISCLVPMVSAGACIDGCCSIDVNIFQFYQITAKNSGTCTSCNGSGSFTEYTITLLTGGCSGSQTATSGKFCSSDDSFDVNDRLEVNSIGAGCSGPQGCVRLCDCD